MQFRKTRKYLGSAFVPSSMNAQGDTVGLLTEDRWSLVESLAPPSGRPTGPAVWYVGYERPTMLPAFPEAMLEFGSPVPLAINDKGLIAGMFFPRYARKLPFAVGPDVEMPPQYAFLYSATAGYSFVEVPDGRISTIALTNDNVLGATALFDAGDYGLSGDGVYECPFTRKQSAGPYVVPSACRFVKRGGSWELEFPEFPSEDPEQGGPGVLPLSAHDPAARKRGYYSWVVRSTCQGKLLVAVNQSADLALPALWERKGDCQMSKFGDPMARIFFCQALFCGDDGTMVGLDVSTERGYPAEDHLMVHRASGSQILAPPKGVFRLEIKWTVCSPDGRFLATTGRKCIDPNPYRSYEPVPVVWERLENGEYGEAQIAEFPPTWYEFVRFLAITNEGVVLVRHDDVWEDGPCTSFRAPNFQICEPE